MEIVYNLLLVLYLLIAAGLVYFVLAQEPKQTGGDILGGLERSVPSARSNRRLVPHYRGAGDRLCGAGLAAGPFAALSNKLEHRWASALDAIFVFGLELPLPSPCIHRLVDGPPSGGGLATLDISRVTRYLGPESKASCVNAPFSSC